MSLTRYKSEPYHFYFHYTFKNSLPSVWATLKDPMALYHFLVAFNKSNYCFSQFPSFPLLYDLYAINTFYFERNYYIDINKNNSIETDYFCCGEYLLKENQNIRSKLLMCIHYGEPNLSYFTVYYINYATNNIEQLKGKLSTFITLHSIEKISKNFLISKAQTENKVINATFDYSLKFFTNVIICTNLLGEIKKTSNTEVAKGAIIVSYNKTNGKEITLQIKTIKITAGMFDMVIFVYEKSKSYPSRKFIVRLNSINNNTQTYASLITEFFNRTNEKELQELGLTKKMILNKITKIIETLKKKSDNKTINKNFVNKNSLSDKVI